MSVSDTHTLGDLGAYIDDHLKPGLLLMDMGPLVGLSPSHFARKFRNSTGMSLHRFFNYPRIQASFAPLRANNVSLARLSIELGFASQSHFTRLFSELPGVTPATVPEPDQASGGPRRLQGKSFLSSRGRSSARLIRPRVDVRPPAELRRYDQLGVPPLISSVTGAKLVHGSPERPEARPARAGTVRAQARHVDVDEEGGRSHGKEDRKGETAVGR